MRKSKAHKALEALLADADIMVVAAESLARERKQLVIKAEDMVMLRQSHRNAIEETLAGVERDFAATKATPPEESD